MATYVPWQGFLGYSGQWNYAIAREEALTQDEHLKAAILVFKCFQNFRFQRKGKHTVSKLAN